MLFVVWQGWARAHFHPAGRSVTGIKQDHRCHDATSRSYPGGSDSKRFWILFFFLLYSERTAENVTRHVYVSCENTGDGPTSHFSIFKWACSNSSPRQHENASPHNLRCSASLLDNILARVSHPPDSDTAFASAASLEMHITLLVVPHSWPNWFNWSARSNGEHMLGDWQPGRSENIPKFSLWYCSDRLNTVAVNTFTGKSVIKMQRNITQGIINMDTTTVISVIVHIRHWASCGFRPD